MNPEAAMSVDEAVEELGPQRRFQPYPEYRDSGVEWLRHVPRSWDTVSLKRIFRVVNGSTPKSSEELFWDGEIPWATPDDLGSLSTAEIRATARRITHEGYESCGTTLVPAGSIVVSTRAPIGHLAIAAVPLCVNQGCRCLVPRSAIDSRYFYYELLAAGQELQSWGQGSTFRELGKSELESVCLACPTIEEQRAIAVFLDRETARIDELVAKKQRLIELLAEKRTALISHAVTKGLNPDAPMKDTGIAWLGEIPSAWTVHQLRRVVRRFVDYRGRTPTKTDSGISLITAGAVRDGSIDHSRAPEYMAEHDYQDWMCRGWPEKDDVVITTEAPLAEVALVDDVHVAFAQRIILFKLDRSRVHPEWMRYYYIATAGRSELLSRASGSTATGIRADRLRMSLVLVPSLEEQRAIIEHLNPRVAELTAPIDSIQSAIAALREYRSALISAAVTGKIDVRGEVNG